MGRQTWKALWKCIENKHVSWSATSKCISTSLIVLVLFKHRDDSNYANIWNIIQDLRQQVILFKMFVLSFGDINVSFSYI